MLHIKRQNNTIKYAFEPSNHEDDITHCGHILVPHPTIHVNSGCVRMDKWYIANHDLIDQVIEVYVTRFQDFVSTHPKYIVHLDVIEFKRQLIKKLYKASESRKKNFV